MWIMFSVNAFETDFARQDIKVLSELCLLNRAKNNDRPETHGMT